MSPTESFQRVWETLRCYIYDHKNEHYQTSILFTRQIPTCKAPKLSSMAVNLLLWSFQKSSKRQNRCVSRNVLGRGSFLGIRALQLTIIYNMKKKGPAGKCLRFFLLETLKNCTLNKKFNP